MVRIYESYCGVKQGMTFGSWNILGKPFSNGSGRGFVVVQCKCGDVRSVDCGAIKGGRSSGCNSCRRARHGESRTRLYNVWCSMLQRCNYKNSISYKNYGGRGIAVCEEWTKSYEAFRDWCLSNGYSKELQLDRIDNNSGYSPSNCRFVTRTKNLRNMRNNIVIEHEGETKTLAEWAEDSRCVVGYEALRNRVKYLGWDFKKALESRGKVISR